MDKIINCDIVRDLLPLYIDGICSSESAGAVDAHIADCRDCKKLLCEMKENEIENALIGEKESVIAHQAKKMRRSGMVAGGIIALVFSIPILVCLIVNLASGKGLDWFFIVLSSLLLASSLTIVPLMVRENKALWTLGSFTLSLILLLGVCCLYSGGDWFFVASASALFGLGCVFLPFVANAKPIKAYLKNHRALAVIAALTVLFALMMICIGAHTEDPDFARVSFAFAAPCVAFIWLLLLFGRYCGKSRAVRAGLCVICVGAFLFFSNSIFGALLGSSIALPQFSLDRWSFDTIDANVRYIVLIASALTGAALIVAGLLHRLKERKENTK